MRYSRGLTLIELSVALFVGSIIAFAAFEIFFSARAVYDIQQDRARERENLRFASFFPVYTSRIAGYLTPADSDRGATFGDPVIRGIDEAQGTVVVTDDSLSVTLDVLTGTDVLAVSYAGHGDGLVRNCLNQRVGANQLAMDVFYIRENGTLHCAAVRNNENVFDRALTSGIVGFEVLYGEDTNGDGAVNRYAPMTTTDDFSSTVALRLKLCAVGEIDDGTPGERRAEAEAHVADCGEPAVNPDDWVVQTIALRNLLP